MANKIIKQTAVSLKCPLKQALCVLCLDDFWDNLKQKGAQVWDRLYGYYQDNK